MADKGTDNEQAADVEDQVDLSVAEELSAGWDDLSQDDGAQVEETAALEEVATDDDEDAQTDEEVGEDDEEAVEAEAESEEAEDDPHIEAPQHWSAEDRETFASLDKSGQKFLLRRHKDMEADYTRRAQEVAEVRKALDPYRSFLESNGISDGDAIRRLVNAQQTLERDPVNATAWLANQYVQDPNDARTLITALAQRHGIDLGLDFDSEEQANPEVQNLRQELNQIRQSLTQREQSEQQAAQQSVQQQIASFRDAKDEQGNPKHPHFDKVRAHMGSLMSSGAAQDMDSAYEQAVWAVPELRADLLKAQTEQQKKQSEVDKRKRAAAAKKKALPASKGSGTQAKAEPKSLSDDLNANWDALAS